MAKSAASETALGLLHAAVTKGLTDIIVNGIKVVVKGPEGDEVIDQPASPAYYAAAIAMLKANNITASAEHNEALQDLSAKLAAKRSAGKLSLADASSLDRAAADFAKLAGSSTFQ